MKKKGKSWIIWLILIAALVALGPMIPVVGPYIGLVRDRLALGVAKALSVLKGLSLPSTSGTAPTAPTAPAGQGFNLLTAAAQVTALVKTPIGKAGLVIFFLTVGRGILLWFLKNSGDTAEEIAKEVGNRASTTLTVDRLVWIGWFVAVITTILPLVQAKAWATIGKGAIAPIVLIVVCRLLEKRVLKPSLAAPVSVLLSVLFLLGHAALLGLGVGTENRFVAGMSQSVNALAAGNQAAVSESFLLTLGWFWLSIT